MQRPGIVVLTNGMRRAPSLRTGWKPDLAAHMRILGAARLYHEAYENDISPYVIISGGKINGVDNPALSHVLGNVAINVYHISAEDVFLEDRSIDTTENAEFSMDLIRRRGLENRISLITSGYHLPRSKAAFKRYGANIVNAFVAEDLISDISPRHERFVRTYKEDPDLRKIRVRNHVLHAAFLTAGPRFLRWLARRELNKKGERFVPTK